MAYRTINHELDRQVKALETQGYKWVGNIYPIAYGHKAPAGFAGYADERQQRFNRMVHLSMQPSDATIAEFNSGMVVYLPKDSVWCHWLATGAVPDEFLANNSDMEILETFAHFHAVLNAFRCDRAEFHARMMLRNEQVFEEWLEDYAERNGMFVESARLQVMEERANAARSAGSVAGAVTRKAEGTPRHESSYYESHCTPLIGKHDVINHDWKLSFEWTQARIRRQKEERAVSRKHVKGLTVADLNAAGLSYSDLAKTESYGIDPVTGEIVVTRTNTGKVLRGTGKFCKRALEAVTYEPKPEPKKATPKKRTTKRTTARKPTAKGQASEPKKEMSAWNKASLRRAQEKRAADKARRAAEQLALSL